MGWIFFNPFCSENILTQLTKIAGENMLKCQECGKPRPGHSKGRCKACWLKSVNGVEGKLIPKTCLHCGKHILVKNTKEHRTSSKIFCNANCFALYRAGVAEGTRITERRVKTACAGCGKAIDLKYTRRRHAKVYYCSAPCRKQHRKAVALASRLIVPCSYCATPIEKMSARYVKTRNYCSYACWTRWRHENQPFKPKKGCRSKNERALYEYLKETYADMKLIPNSRTVLEGGLELDIWCPSLEFAIEWNGIHHYKPIYGEQRFAQTKAKDSKKKRMTKKKGIRLLVIRDVGEKDRLQTAIIEVEEALKVHIFERLQVQGG
jgi:hypothetical protein